MSLSHVYNTLLRSVNVTEVVLLSWREWRQVGLLSAIAVQQVHSHRMRQVQRLYPLLQIVFPNPLSDDSSAQVHQREGFSCKTTFTTLAYLTTILLKGCWYSLINILQHFNGKNNSFKNNNNQWPHM